MIFLYVLSGIFLAGITYILFAPIYIEVNSVHSIYRIRFHRLLQLSFFVNNNPSLIEMKLGFWKKQFDLSKAPKQKEPIADTKKKKASPTFPFRKLLAVIKSFKVNRLDATFDLGDMQLNGMLYPLFCWVSFRTGKNVYINFEGRNNIDLQIENCIARMSRAFLRS
jgi:hypothetical protein